MHTIFNILDEVKDNLESLEFHEALYEARERLGLRLYRVAEHTDMTMGRLKRLESGVYRGMPDRQEIDNLCDFYGFPKEKMIDKASNYVDRYKKHVKADRYIDGGS